jgi:hypothetical protein
MNSAISSDLQQKIGRSSRIRKGENIVQRHKEVMADRNELAGVVIIAGIIIIAAIVLPIVL